MGTMTADEVTTAAETIRAAMAWWRLAADRLEAGDVAQARDYAKLGAFGTEGMVDRLDALGREVSHR